MARGVFTPGNDASATELNDAFSPPHCRIRHSVSQALTTATSTALAFDTETEDVGSCHDTATNNTRITVPAGGNGWWGFTACAEFAANATGHRDLSIRINGTTIAAVVRDTTPSGTKASRIALSAEFRLNVGDYVELIGYQDSGGNLNVVAGSAYSPVMTGRWLCV